MTERECPRCHREVHLPLGALCPQCRSTIARRARRVARLGAGGSTVIVAIYVMLRMPDLPHARLVGGVGVFLWLVLTYTVIHRVMMQWQR